MTLPEVCAGPLLRRAEPSRVLVWLATSRPLAVRGEVFALAPQPHHESPRRMGWGRAQCVRLGPRLYVHLVSMHPDPAIGRFPTDRLLGYDLALGVDDTERGSAPSSSARTTPPRSPVSHHWTRSRSTDARSSATSWVSPPGRPPTTCSALASSPPCTWSPGMRPTGPTTCPVPPRRWRPGQAAAWRPGNGASTAGSWPASSRPGGRYRRMRGGVVAHRLLARRAGTTTPHTVRLPIQP
jgi:hypothetical protein